MILGSFIVVQTGRIPVILLKFLVSRVSRTEISTCFLNYSKFVEGGPLFVPIFFCLVLLRHMSDCIIFSFLFLSRF